MITRTSLGVVCDFDGTITTEDTTWAMLKEFGPAGWERWEEEYHAGRITDQRAIIHQFATMRAPISELTRWALERARIRPGARDFLRWCAARGIPVTVASNGVDFYIRPVLEAHGLMVPDLVCGHAAAAGAGIAVSYDHLWDQEYPDERDQKRLAVARLRARGLRVVYIGDGLPDYPAAVTADVIFARYHLLERCRAHGTPCHSYENFWDILAACQKAGAQNEASCPGGAAGWPGANRGRTRREVRQDRS